MEDPGTLKAILVRRLSPAPVSCQLLSIFLLCNETVIAYYKKIEWD